jgi:hypothetical protein
LEFFRLFNNARAVLQNRQGAGARKRFLPLSWATGLKSAQYYSSVSFFFYFQSQNNFRKWLKNYKIVKPIFLGSLFSLEFNKNSFVIFSGNKKI